MIRASRVHRAVCEAQGGSTVSGCSHSKYVLADIDEIMAEAKSRGVCKKERFIRASWLYYIPVEVDFEAQPGG